MDDLLPDFLTEAFEGLAELDIDLVRFEGDPNDDALLANIFRTVHTIKGTCGFIGLPRPEALAHSAENVLGRFRDGELAVTSEHVTLILESVDQLKAILIHLDQNQEEPDGTDDNLIARLDSVADLDGAPTVAPVADSADPVETDDQIPGFATDEAADGNCTDEPEWPSSNDMALEDTLNGTAGNQIDEMCR